MYIQKTGLLERTTSKSSEKNHFEFCLGCLQLWMFRCARDALHMVVDRIAGAPKHPWLETGPKFYRVLQNEIAKKILLRKLQDRERYSGNFILKDTITLRPSLQPWVFRCACDPVHHHVESIAGAPKHPQLETAKTELKVVFL